MYLTKIISSFLVNYYKLLPILLMALCWWFFTGARVLFRKKHKRIRREILFCLSVFGLAFGIANFLVYGLVDPANGLARPGALPVPPADFLRFERTAYLSLAVSLLAFVALELSLAKEKREQKSNS